MATTLDFFKTIDEFRQLVEGWDAAQPLTELLPSYKAVRREIINLTGQDTWDAILAYYNEDPPEPEVEVMARAVEFVQSALANLMMNQHFIFIAIRKNKTDGDIYKYQYDELKEKYSIAAWASMDELLGHLDANIATFTDYAALPAYLERQNLILNSYIEFGKYFGIDSSPWFFTKLIFLIKEAQDDEILPRIGSWDDVKKDATIAEKVKRALAYHTMYLALDRFDFTSLPGTIRSQAGNEGNRTINIRYSDDAAKLLLANKLRQKAAEYFTDIELLIKQLSTAGLTSPVNPNTETDGFYQMT